MMDSNPKSEKRQVLDMLADGTINSADAEQLLAKLDASSEAAPRGGEPRRSGSARFLRVEVESEDGDRADIRIPLALVATGVRLSSILPEAATDALDSAGIELSELDDLAGEPLAEALRDLEMDIEDHDGGRVRICGE